MRSCGACTLCCELERITELDKPRYQRCEYCAEGCSIYAGRPNSCRHFTCEWLTSDLPESWRPDLVHLYAKVSDDRSYARVMVDPNYAYAWQYEGAVVIDQLRQAGTHVLVMGVDQVNFVCAENKPRPGKLTLDWVL